MVPLDWFEKFQADAKSPSYSSKRDSNRVVRISPNRHMESLIRKRAFAPLPLVLLVFLLSLSADAENWGVVTIQSKFGYGMTFPLSEDLINDIRSKRTAFDADDPDNSNVPGVLSRLRDGDVLVINTHSNVNVFGYGKDSSAQWSQFYSTFRARSNLRPSLVIIHGCMPQSSGAPSTDADLQKVRMALNARGLIAYNITVNPFAGRLSMHGIINGMLRGEQIQSLLRNDALRFVTDGTVDDSTATLSDLLKSGRDVEPPIETGGLSAIHLSSVLASPTADASSAEVTLQYRVEGVAAETRLSYSGTLSGPGVSQPVSGQVTVSRDGYQATGFSIPLSGDATPGRYNLDISLGAGGIRDQKRCHFDLVAPALNVSIIGPDKVDKGDPISLQVRLNKGRPPFRWSWSGGGATGSGNERSFTPGIPAAQGTAVDFTIQVWDGGNHRSTPLITHHIVQVRNNQAPPNLELKIRGPRETCVGRKVAYSAEVTGGTPPYTYSWGTSAGPVAGHYVSHVFLSPGEEHFTLQVTDSSTPPGPPQTIPFSVKVYEKLEATVGGPDRIASGEKFTLDAQPKGGKPPYRFSWTSPRGKSANKQSISGSLVGPPGEAHTFSLVIEDSLEEPQRARTAHQVVMSDSRLRITGLTVSPAELKPGGTATVTMTFDGQGTRGNDNPAFVAFWMEASPGLNRGETKKGQVRMSHRRTSTTFKVRPDAKPGLIRVMGKMAYEELVVKKVVEARIVEDRDESGLQDITVDSRNIQVRIRDHSSEDGDIISLELNGTTIAGPLTITNAGTVFPLTLQPGDNTLSVLAHNEGSSSPNTASMMITNVVKGPSSQKYSLKTGRRGTFKITAP